MNNTVLNNGANNNRGAVVIPRTTREGLNNFTGFNKEIHAAMSRKALRDTLYSWAPIYRMISVNGIDANDNLMYTVVNVVGGNSPVARQFVVKDIVPRTLQVIQYDENKVPLYRTVVTGDPVGRIRYDYCEELVLIRFSDDMDMDENNRTSEELVNDIISKGLTINGDVVSMGKAKEGTHINPLVWTPSNERNGQILFTSLDANIAWNKLEEIGGKAMSRKLAGELELSKFKKLASRLGLFATPAIEFGTVGTDSHGLLLLDYDLIGADDFNAINKKVLKAIGVEIDAKQWDGAAFFSAELALAGLKSIGMKYIDIKKALMFAFQLRINKVYAKVFGEALHQSVLNRMVSCILSELKEIEARTGKKLYRIYGNANCISMILDSNAAKLVDLEMDAEDGMTVYLLDIAKGSQSGTATQMTDKFALFNKEATRKFLKNRGYENCHDYANSIGDNSSSLLDDNLNVWQTMLNIAKTSQNEELAYTIFSDQYVLSRLLKDVSKKHEAAYKKGRVDIASEFERALFDSTYLLTFGKVASLLEIDSRGAVECYSTDMLEKYADEIEAIESNTSLTVEEMDMQLRELLTACIIKYPTPGTEEIELVVFLTEKQIKRRVMQLVANGIIDEETGKIVFNYFSFTSYGVIKIAADNALKHKLAGMDTDYDGVVVIHEKELVDIVVDAYSNRAKKLEESTGLISSHAGLIPFIDSSKTCENFLETKNDQTIDEDSTLNIIGDINCSQLFN